MKQRPGGNSYNNKRGLKNIGFVIIVILIGLIIYASLNKPSELTSVPFSGVVTRANNGEIQKIVVTGDELVITKKATVIQPRNRGKNQDLHLVSKD